MTPGSWPRVPEWPSLGAGCGQVTAATLPGAVNKNNWRAAVGCWGTGVVKHGGLPWPHVPAAVTEIFSI